MPEPGCPNNSAPDRTRSGAAPNTSGCFVGSSTAASSSAYGVKDAARPISTG